MRNKLFILLVLICVNSWLHSTTWHIKQDSTGNFSTIQEGINASADSDTVLVYPGIYYENIDYLEKSLTVASLYIITPEDSLINQTIIDGNQVSQCVRIENCENASITGFTIQGGIADNTNGLYGGGILCDYSNLEISNCKIMYNKAFSGGGLRLNQSTVELIGNTISNNICFSKGGGIYINGNNSSTIFHPELLNNIYFNNAGDGNDIAASNIIEPINVITDTFTVHEINNYFFSPTQYFTFTTENYKIDQIDQDLYVSPEGDDSNSGLVPEEPLKTISWAQSLIKINDDNPNTIHLAEGVYSPSLNAQIFPLNIKHGVKIVGISTEETILDAEDQTPFIFFNSKEDIYISLNLQDLTLLNARTFDFPPAGAITINYQADMILKNVIIENYFGDHAGAIYCSDGFYDFNNISVRNNIGGHSIKLNPAHQNQNPLLNVDIINSTIMNNVPGPGQDNGNGGGLILGGHLTNPGDFEAKLINCEIIVNHNNFYNSQTGLGGAVGLYLRENLIADIVNCTMGDNTLSYNTGCLISVLDAELNLYNSIIHNNEGYSFIIWSDEEVNISNSLIESGDSNVHYCGNGAINWMEGNLDEDPNWDVTGEYPFALTGNSPCIDVGTLDLPAGIELPEYDLAGNPRIYGDTIDMGAYEFQGDPQSNDENEIVIPEVTQISNYPNPFNPSTTIKLDLAESGRIELAIYNIKGQKVKTLLDAYSSKGHFDIIWRGIDDNKKKIASGQYFIKLYVNGKEKAVSKCVLLK